MAPSPPASPRWREEGIIADWRRNAPGWCVPVACWLAYAGIIKRRSHGLRPNYRTLLAGISAPVWGLIALFAGVAVAVIKFWQPIRRFQRVLYRPDGWPSTYPQAFNAVFAPLAPILTVSATRSAVSGSGLTNCWNRSSFPVKRWHPSLPVQGNIRQGGRLQSAR